MQKRERVAVLEDAEDGWRGVNRSPCDKHPPMTGYAARASKSLSLRMKRREEELIVISSHLPSPWSGSHSLFPLSPWRRKQRGGPSGRTRLGGGLARRVILGKSCSMAGDQRRHDGQFERRHLGRRIAKQKASGGRRRLKNWLNHRICMLNIASLKSHNRASNGASEATGDVPKREENVSGNSAFSLQTVESYRRNSPTKSGA